MGKIVKLKQFGDEWLKWRHQGLGSSDASAIQGISPWKSPLQLLEEKARDQHYVGIQTHAMRRGSELEPIARNLYTRKTYLTMVPVTMESESIPFMKASLDGWNPHQKIALEIKCPSKLDHDKALAGEVPEKYAPQLQHILAVSGAELLHYVSYDGRQIALVEVKVQKEYQDRLVSQETEFWAKVQDLKLKRLENPNYQLPIEDAPQTPRRLVRRLRSVGF